MKNLELKIEKEGKIEGFSHCSIDNGCSFDELQMHMTWDR